MLKQIRVLTVGLAVLGTAFPQISLTLSAQDAPPPPAGTANSSAKPPANFKTAAELDRMLAPIALYPDPLLAQILPAATVPSDVVLASRYLKSGKDAAKIDAQPWNESVKAVAHYPDVLKMMDEKLDWTTELGQAYLAQPDDVFASVQHLRQQAQQVGNLKTTPQQVVTTTNQVITIAPANPQIIYVPTYPPTTVYTTPPPDPAVSILAFGAGLAIGAWLANDHDDYWYARGHYYHGYHGGGYYGGNNSVNINNSKNVNINTGNNGNNVNIGNGNGNGNRTGTINNRPATGNGGSTGAGRPGAGGSNGASRPNTGAQQRPANTGNGFSRESSKPQQKAAGRPGSGPFGGGAGAKASRPSSAGAGAARGGGNGGGAARNAGPAAGGGGGLRGGR